MGCMFLSCLLLACRDACSDVSVQRPNISPGWHYCQEFNTDALFTHIYVDYGDVRCPHQHVLLRDGEVGNLRKSNARRNHVTPPYSYFESCTRLD